MSATWAFDDNPRAGHPLLPGASPAAIRAGLLPEDRQRFDTAYETALVQAKSSLDLTELFRTLEHWRRLALLQSNPVDYQRVVRRTAEALTGQPTPPDEPLAVTRERAGLQACTASTQTTTLSTRSPPCLASRWAPTPSWERSAVEPQSLLQHGADGVEAGSGQPPGLDQVLAVAELLLEPQPPLGLCCPHSPPGLDTSHDRDTDS